jgi:hypothetical protein
MNKTRNFITLLSLLLLCSTNLCANEAMAKRWGYGATGCGILTALIAIGFGYKYIQLKRNNALLNNNKNLTPKQFEKILKLKKSNKRWLKFLGFTMLVCGAGTVYCLYKRHQEKNNNENPVETKPEFMPKLLKCPLCLEDNKKCMKLDCGHYACQACLKDMLVHALNNFNTEGVHLRCTDTICKKQFTINDIRGILYGDKDYHSILYKFQKCTVKNHLLEDKNSKRCPTPNCNAIFIYEGANGGKPPIIVCDCNAVYCANCLENHDQKIPCQTKRYVSKEIMNLIRSDERYKPCPNPSCYVLIEKISGCNHVTCGTCKHGFCFKCLRRWFDPGNRAVYLSKPNNYANCPPRGCQNPNILLPSHIHVKN